MACRIRIKGNRGRGTGIRVQGPGIGDQGPGARSRGSEIKDQRLEEVMKLKKYRDLEVLQKAMDLVVMYYQIAGESRRIQC